MQDMGNMGNTIESMGTIEERIPPHNPDAERSVLGAALLSKDALFDVLETVRPDDFYDPNHKEIFSVIFELGRRNAPVDALTVSEELDKRGSLQMVGGRAYVAGLSSTTPTTANAAEYAKIVAEKSSIRKLIKTADDIVAKYEIRERLTASYTLYILMMSVFVISFFYKGNNDIFRARAKLSGIKTWKIFLIESGCAAVMIYMLYIVMFVCLCFIFDSMKILSLITVIPTILIIALLGTALCYLVKSPAAVSYITFGAGTLMMYLAGGLIPIDFMSRFFQNAAVYNPFYYLIRFFMRSMFL